MLDFTKFETKELEDMLVRHKDELTKMVMMSGLEAKVSTIKQIEFVLGERENAKGETEETSKEG